MATNIRCKVCRQYTAYRACTPCLHCQKNPPLFHGGQGRSSHDIESDGLIAGMLMSTFITLCALLICMALCSS